MLAGCRIQKDIVDPEKLQATLGDKSLAEACDLKKGLEMVAVLEAQLKEMNPNLDSISEYAFCSQVCTSILLLFYFAKGTPYGRYRTKVSLYNERVAELNSVTQQHDDVKRQYDDWRKKRQGFPFSAPCYFSYEFFTFIYQCYPILQVR